jgi:YgiT-type zinc finger domain-containing protein
MICDCCGCLTERRRVRKHHWYKGRLYVIENVLVEVCQKCGQRYFHAITLDAIDQLLAGNHPVKDTLQVEVVAM